MRIIKLIIAILKLGVLIFLNMLWIIISKISCFNLKISLFFKETFFSILLISSLNILVNLTIKRFNIIIVFQTRSKSQSSIDVNTCIILQSLYIMKYAWWVQFRISLSLFEFIVRTIICFRDLALFLVIIIHIQRSWRATTFGIKQTGLFISFFNLIKLLLFFPLSLFTLHMFSISDIIFCLFISWITVILVLEFLISPLRIKKTYLRFFLNFIRIWVGNLCLVCLNIVFMI